MQIREVNLLRGPNIWASFSVLEALVDLGPWKDLSSEMLPGFNDRLKGWLPTLIEHRCSVGERGGFFQRLDRGTYLAHILEHVTLELQTLAGCDVGFGRARETDEEGVYYVAIEYLDEVVGQRCLEAAKEICMAAVEGRPIDMPSIVSQLRELAHDEMLGPSTTAIVQAAAARNIPYRRLNRESLVQLGHGARQRRILTAETDRTGAIAESIAQDKQLTRSLLRAIGAPVPVGRPVADAEDAWRAAEEIGLPVVVKPRYGNHGRGVATNLNSRQQVLAAYAAAREESRHVIVESFAPGDDHRLLVIGGRLAAAALREPAHVIGDGRSSIRQLVETANRDPRRSDGHATALSFLKLDNVALGVLEEQQLTPESILTAGQKALIRRNGNLSTGGAATDVTERVHPQVAEVAVAAAAMVGLDIAGIDIVATDIGQPLEGQRGAIVEVNAGPGLRMHLQPSFGNSRPVGEAIVDMLYPAESNGRIPIVAMTEADASGQATVEIFQLLQAANAKLSPCGRRLDERFRFVGGRNEATALEARDLLLDPRAEGAFFEVSSAMILNQGLPFDACDVAVVLNIEHAGNTVASRTSAGEKLLRVKRTLVEAVSPNGYAVLSAHEPLAPSIAAACPGGVIYIALSASPLEAAPFAEHLKSGGRMVLFDEGDVVLAEGDHRRCLASSVDGGDDDWRTGGVSRMETLLAGVAAGWALGLAEANLADFLHKRSALAYCG